MKQRLILGLRIKSYLLLILPPALILITGILAFFGILTYKVAHPAAVPEAVNPSFFMLPSLDVSFASKAGPDISAWLIPGLKGAPGIVLLPGYGMTRSDILSLGAALHEEGFNLLIYDQRGSGAAPRESSTFGLYETDDLVNAIQFLQMRPESNRARIGVWGVDSGAFAALKAAAVIPEITAVAADGAFESPDEFLDIQVYENFGFKQPSVQFGCRQIFHLAHVSGRSFLKNPFPIHALSDRMILFIQGENRRQLGSLTSGLYNKIQPRKEMISLKTSRIHMMDGEDQKSYDRQVANFFHVNLQ
jgi:pimeloyl-ACP methyl ester carboxylesterase